nr:hypothetical protein [Rikenellaceae bacterium]
MIKRLLSGSAIIYATIFCLLALLFAKNGLDMAIPMKGILLVAIAPAFFASPTQMIAMALTFIPLGSGFQYKYALMAYVLIGIVRFGSQMHFSKLTFPLIVMILWEMLHVVVGEMEINELMRGFAEFVFLWFISCQKLKDLEIRVIARSLAIAVVGVCCITMYMQTTLVMGDVSDVLSQGSDGSYRFGNNNNNEEELFSLVFNPNQLGFICNLAIAALLVLMRLRKSTLIDVVMLSLCVTFGSFTLSRTFLVCLAFLLISFILLSTNSLRQRVFYIILLTLLIGGVVWAIDAFLPDVIKNFTARFEVEDLSNNRIDLFVFYNQHIFSTAEYCLFGIGLQNFGEKLIQLYNPDIEVCHNGFQEAWVAWGLPGLVMVLWWLKQLVAESRRWCLTKRYFSYLPLILILLDMQAGQFIRSNTNMLALILAYAVLCIPSERFELKQV